MKKSEEEGERGKFEGELFSVLHSCRSNLEGEAGPSEVLSWKLFCSLTGKSHDVTLSHCATHTIPICTSPTPISSHCAIPTHPTCHPHHLIQM